MSRMLPPNICALPPCGTAGGHPEQRRMHGEARGASHAKRAGVVPAGHRWFLSACGQAQLSSIPPVRRMPLRGAFFSCSWLSQKYSSGDNVLFGGVYTTEAQRVSPCSRAVACCLGLGSPGG